MKRCSKCKVLKPITDFHKDSKHTDGKRSECKDCQRIKIKKWNDNNKEWRKTRDAEYHKTHYYRGYRKEYLQNWYQKNKERIREQHREYLMNHKEESTLRTAKYRQRKLSLECSLTNEQWETIKLVFKNRCVYCGKRTRRLEREHVIPVSSGGGLILQNIVPSCHSCNAKKNTNLPKIPIKLMLI